MELALFVLQDWFGILSEGAWQDESGAIIVIAPLQLEQYQLDKQERGETDCSRRNTYMKMNE